MTMSDVDSSSSEAVDGTVLQDQMEACDGIINRIVESHEDPSKSPEEDLYNQINGIYQRVRANSIQAFEGRFQTSALYAALKTLLRRIGEERGYEERMHYTRRGKDLVADGIDNSVYWFKLYASVVLEIQPRFTYEWAVPHFKEHRDLIVSHPTTLQPLRDGPDPTLVSSVVPLWYVLEDILRLWREVLDMDAEKREQREYVLNGEVASDGGLATHRYGFINTLNHRTGKPDIGFITGYQNGENGKGSRFRVEDVDFFPSIGEVVEFQAEQRTNEKGEEFGALTVTDTVALVE